MQVNERPSQLWRLPGMLSFIAISITSWLGGCGWGVLQQTPVPVTVAVTPAVQSSIATVTNFGDSITCGYTASPQNGMGYVYSLNGYAGLLDAAIGKPSQNLCRGGDQATDMARLWVYPNARPAMGLKQLYTILIGTNDANACGGSSVCMSHWSEALSASIAWLALPESDKVLGANITNHDPSWIADAIFTSGLATTTRGATLRFEVNQAVPGRSPYVAYRVFDSGAGNAGAALLSVDGAPVMMLNASVQGLKTTNGVLDSVFLQNVQLNATGQHTISVTTTSTDGSTFSFLWAGVSSGSYANVSGAPRVMVATIPQTGSKMLNEIVGSYNSMLLLMLDAFIANGLNIQIAPTDVALQTSDLVDELHPNNVGHSKIAAAIANALQKQ